jgi:type I restriction enzyme R subunit
MVSKDKKYQNAMRNSDEQEARTESERALQQVIFSIMADNMELFKQFQDNPSFKKWLSDLVFNLTYNPEGKEYVMPSPETKSITYSFQPQQLSMVAEKTVPYGKKDENQPS